MRHFFILCLCLSIFACSKNNSELVDILRKTATIQFPLDSLTNITPYFSQIYEDKGQEYLYYANKEAYTIQIYNIASKKLEKTIKLNRSGPNQISSYRGFVIKNADSLYIVGSSAYTLYLINNKADVLRKYTWASDDIIANSELSDIGIMQVHGNSYGIIKNDTLFVLAAPDLNPHKANFYTKGNVGQWINLKTGKVGFVLNFPKIYCQKNYSYLFGHYYLTSNEKQELVYSFSGSDSLNISKIGSWSFFNTMLAKSNDISTIESLPAPLGGVTSEEQFYKYMQTKPQYAGIWYDKYRKIYYRVALQKDDTIKNAWSAQPFSIIVLDNNFKKVGETKFPAKKYHYLGIMVGKEGLYLPLGNANNEEIDEENLVYDIFKLNETK
jgi:hypothetical protein